MADLIVRDLPGYRLLDSGDGRKLEEIAGLRLERPCPQAIWPVRLGDDAWQAPSRCLRTDGGGGRWEHTTPPPPLALTWQGPAGAAIRLDLRLTAFGHCGVFVEQIPLWEAAQRHLAQRGGGKALNLFGYTGGASLAAAAAGAEVFHVDSARGVLDWGRDNQRASGLGDGCIHWICEDARSSVQLSTKRGFRYDVIFCDPPAWGHGPRKQTFTFETDAGALVSACAGLLAPGGLLLVSAHTPGVQAAALVNLVPGLEVSAGDLLVAHQDDPRLLPAGVYAIARRA